MSMTREEAIIRIKNHMEYCGIGEYPHVKLAEALNMALSALRPVSWEQVERMAGEWVQNINKGPAMFYCSSCGESFEIHSYEFQKYRFCPFCMTPMTDEAAQMVMDRMKALKNDSTTD